MLYTINFINGHDLKFDTFSTKADSEEEAIAKLYELHGDFDHTLISIEENDDVSYVRFPNQFDVLQLNSRNDAHTSDEMIDLYDWDGECWETLFNSIVKEHADKWGMKQWDVFAALLHNFIFEE